MDISVETIQMAEDILSSIDANEEFMEHHGVKGQKHGVRRYQNDDGSLTALGRQHYGIFGRLRSHFNPAEQGYRAAVKQKQQQQKIAVKKAKYAGDIKKMMKKRKYFTDEEIERQIDTDTRLQQKRNRLNELMRADKIKRKEEKIAEKERKEAIKESKLQQELQKEAIKSQEKQHKLEQKTLLDVQKQKDKAQAEREQAQREYQTQQQIAKGKTLLGRLQKGAQMTAAIMGIASNVSKTAGIFKEMGFVPKKLDGAAKKINEAKEAVKKAVPEKPKGEIPKPDPPKPDPPKPPSGQSSPQPNFSKPQSGSQKPLGLPDPAQASNGDKSGKGGLFSKAREAFDKKRNEKNSKEEQIKEDARKTLSAYQKSEEAQTEANRARQLRNEMWDDENDYKSTVSVYDKEAGIYKKAHFGGNFSKEESEQVHKALEYQEAKERKAQLDYADAVANSKIYTDPSDRKPLAQRAAGFFGEKKDDFVAVMQGKPTPSKTKKYIQAMEDIQNSERKRKEREKLDKTLSGMTDDEYNKIMSMAENKVQKRHERKNALEKQSKEDWEAAKLERAIARKQEARRKADEQERIERQEKQEQIRETKQEIQEAKNELKEKFSMYVGPARKDIDISPSMKKLFSTSADALAREMVETPISSRPMDFSDRNQQAKINFRSYVNRILSMKHSDEEIAGEVEDAE